MCKQGFVTEGRQPGFIPARAKPFAHMCSPLLAPARVNQRASIHGPKSVCLWELATAPCLQSGVLWIFVNIGTAPAPLTSSGGAAPPWPPKFSLVLFARPLFLTLVPVFDPTVVLCWLSLPALRVVLHESLCSDSQLLASSVIAAMSLPLTNELASCCLYTRRQAIRPPFLVPVHLPLQQDEPRSPASLPHLSVEAVSGYSNLCQGKWNNRPASSEPAHAYTHRRQILKMMLQPTTALPT